MYEITNDLKRMQPKKIGCIQRLTLKTKHYENTLSAFYIFFINTFNNIACYI